MSISTFFTNIVNKKTNQNQQEIFAAQLSAVKDRHSEAADRVINSVKSLLEENDKLNDRGLAK
jgi:hypothetical protein